MTGSPASPSFGDLNSPRFVNVAKVGEIFSFSVYLPSQQSRSSWGSKYMLCLAPNIDRDSLGTNPPEAQNLIGYDLVYGDSVTVFDYVYESTEPLTFGAYAYCVDASGNVLVSSMDDFVTIAAIPQKAVVAVSECSDFKMSDCSVIGKEVGISFSHSNAVISDTEIKLESGSDDYIDADEASTVVESNVQKSVRS